MIHAKVKVGQILYASSLACNLTEATGFKQGLRAVAGFYTQEKIMCNACKGGGNIFKGKDRCKKCKGERVTEARKVLEIYIPRGSKYVS